MARVTRGGLRALVAARGSYPVIAAAVRAGRLPLALAPPLVAHVGDVYRRLEMAADARVELRGLRTTALVHEEPPARVPGLLEAAGVPEWTPLATTVIGAFGAVWRAETTEALAGYVRRHRARLAEVLLFELAHEGRPTAAMEAAARLGGLDGRFRGWVRGLRDGLPTLPRLE